MDRCLERAAGLDPGRRSQYIRAPHPFFERTLMNLGALSTGTKVLLGAGLLLFIDLFLDWQQRCADTTVGSICVGRSGWHGIGVLVGLLVLALLVWEVAQLLNLLASVNLPI